MSTFNYTINTSNNEDYEWFKQTCINHGLDGKKDIYNFYDNLWPILPLKYRPHDHFYVFMNAAEILKVITRLKCPDIRIKIGDLVISDDVRKLMTTGLQTKVLSLLNQNGRHYDQLCKFIQEKLSASPNAEWHSQKFRYSVIYESILRYKFIYNKQVDSLECIPSPFFEDNMLSVLDYVLSHINVEITGEHQTDRQNFYDIHEYDDIKVSSFQDVETIPRNLTRTEYFNHVSKLEDFDEDDNDGTDSSTVYCIAEYRQDDPSCLDAIIGPYFFKNDNGILINMEEYVYNNCKTYLKKESFKPTEIDDELIYAIFKFNNELVCKHTTYDYIYRTYFHYAFENRDNELHNYTFDMPRKHEILSPNGGKKLYTYVVAHFIYFLLRSRIVPNKIPIPVGALIYDILHHYNFIRNTSDDEDEKCKTDKEKYDSIKYLFKFDKEANMYKAFVGLHDNIQKNTAISKS